MAKNSSPPIQSLPYTQADILDLVLFPGFSRISTTIQEHLRIDLNLYIPLLCFLGLFSFVSKRIYEFFLGWVENFFLSTIHVRYGEEPYHMIMLWICSKTSLPQAHSALVSTELTSAWSRLGRSRTEHTKHKTLHYSPWNGCFFFWYRGHLLIFRRQGPHGDLYGRELVSVSCLGRSTRILKKLLAECDREYSKLIQDKTSLFEHQEGSWERSTSIDIRRISTVIMDEDQKRELLKDMNAFLDPNSQRWYSNRGIPYRKGYLLYGPPGTGKSSLCRSIAGHFGLDVYILRLSSITENGLLDLYARLPSRCVILLEDIDAVSSKRSGENGTTSQARNPVSGKVPLSVLLNVIDGVGSGEGRVLIMTTNFIKHLDNALIRPGRVDMKVELGLATEKITADLFCIVYKPMEGDAMIPKVAIVEEVVGEKTQNKHVYESATKQVEDVGIVDRLAEEFAGMVPELEFSPAEILAYLSENRQSPSDAIENVEAWVTKTRQDRVK